QRGNVTHHQRLPWQCLKHPKVTVFTRKRLFELPFPGEDGDFGVLEALPRQPLVVRDISSLAFDPVSGHTLMLSDESRLLVELDLQGKPRSFMALFGGL